MDQGQQLALSGASGSGKTTLLNLIAGILQPDEGQVELDGQSMSGADEANRDRLRAKLLGYIFQTFNLLQGYTCVENVLLGMSFGGSPDRARAAALLDRVGLSRHLNYYPRQLSTGQQQRVAVARAIVNDPAILLADEPTGNLDEQNADQVMQLLLNLRQQVGSALVVVTHDPALAEMADRVITMHDGRIVPT